VVAWGVAFAQPGAWQRRGGRETDAIIALGSAALGWAFPTLPIHSPGKFSSRHSAPSQFSICFAHCILSTAPLQSLLCFFLFFSAPLSPAPRVLLCFFSPCAQYCLRFRKASFCCPLRPLRRTWRHCFRQPSSAVETRPPPRLCVFPIIARQPLRRIRTGAFIAAGLP
jgi:hypothetical protein